MPPLAALPTLEAADIASLAWAVVATAGLIALRRRIGLAEAVTGALAAWSAALLLWIPPQPDPQGRLLVGLGFVALAIGRLLRERDPAASRAAWALCWLAATAAGARNIARLSCAAAEAHLGLWPVAAALGLLAVFAPRTASGPLALYAAAVYGLLLVRWSGLLRQASAGAGGAAIGLAAAALLGVLGELALRWDRRRRAWERDPSRPAGRLKPPRPLYGVLLVVALAGAAIAALRPVDPLAVPAAFLAALACFVIGHVCGWMLAGVLGLLLVAETIVLAAAAVGGADAYAFAVGWTFAAGWLIWIARFWDQQLLDGRPWTTAGTLIGPARTLGRLATLAVAAAVWLACGPDRLVSLPASLVLAGLLAVLAVMFLRDARTPDRADSAWAGLLLAATVTLPAHAAAARLGVPRDLPLAVWVAAAALVLALPGSLRRMPPVRCAIGWMAPAAAIAYALHAHDTGSIIAAALTLAAAAVVLHGGRSGVVALADP